MNNTVNKNNPSNTIPQKISTHNNTTDPYNSSQLHGRRINHLPKTMNKKKIEF